MKRKLSIEGMKCSHCVGNLKDVLTEDISGVDVLEVNLVGKDYYMDTSVFILVVLFIYVFNILIGLLPVINTIRKTPAKILSRNDI